MPLRFWGILLILLGYSMGCLAQSNFIPLERGDIEEKEDRWAFSPGIQLSGDYRLRANYRTGSDVPGIESRYESGETVIDQEIRLRIRSVMHRMISINLELQAVQDPFNDSDLKTENSHRTPQSQETDIQARQAYLEYNSNPHGILKLGKHYINIGDRRGKVFSGILSGVSQQCTAGTWCYEAGAMKTAPHPSDMLYFLSLDYPIFDDVDEAGNPLNKFNVEIYRIIYTERNIPMGGLTARAPIPADDEVSTPGQNDIYVRDLDNRIMYYDAFEQQFGGLRILWETSSINLSFDVNATQGLRRYHLLQDQYGLIPANLGEGSPLDERKLAKHSFNALSSEFEFSYRLGNHKLTFLNLYARGDKEHKDPDNVGKNYLKTLYGYYEIMPGAYQGNRFYFNGSEMNLRGGTGLGHSINNTSMQGLRYKVKSEDDSIFYEAGLYEMNRDQPVFNDKGTYVRYIGLEWDNIISWAMDKKLRFDLELNGIRPGKAFTFDDFSTPETRKGLILHGVGRVMYSF
ncbi:MAG: hypothetical protein HQM11_08455 [SAR324 cluster bacterium]|nr:hypothetical protein [SAR324 cluster bacterium]